MIKRIFLFIVGWVKISVGSDSALKCTELLRRLAVECSYMKNGGCGDIVFILSLRQFLKFRKGAVIDPFDYVAGEIHGLPKIALFLLKRPGLAVGMVLFSVTTLFSGRIIWNIDVVGNETVSDESIVALLDELGCSYGDDFKKIDFDKLCSELLVKSDDISWISVNMTGTHAKVEVRELRRGGDAPPQKNVGANVIATEDAQIMLVKTEAGIPCVRNGDIVKKGDLLVNGVIPLREGGVRFEYANGEILAYVPRTIQIEIPFKNTEKVYTGRKSKKNMIKIFKKSINLSLNYGIGYTTYDKIIESERICLFGVVPLPVWVDKVSFIEYENSDTVLDVDAAVSAAVRELRYETDEILETCEIVSVKQTCDLSDESYAIKQEMLCITDIGEIREFTTDILPEDDNGL